MAFCTCCGKKLEEGTKFCTSCGHAVNGDNSTKQRQATPDNCPKKSKPKTSGNVTKWIVIIASVCILITAVIIGLLYFNKPSIDATKAQEQLQEILETVKSQDSATPEFLQEAEKRSGFEALSCVENKDSATVTFQVYGPDLYSVIKELDENSTFDNDNEIDKAVAEAIKNAPIVETVVEITFVLQDNEYVPVITTDFWDAYYGGIIRLLNEKLDGLNAN